MTDTAADARATAARVTTEHADDKPPAAPRDPSRSPYHQPTNAPPAAPETSR